jgi:multisubunit Na+/H+ antiporter MnhF subunit
MTLVADKPVELQPGPKHWSDRLLVREMWGTLAISVMWLAVLFDAIYGADIVSVGNDGTATRLPSAVVIALFAFLGTAAVAKRVFGRKTES